MSEGISRNSKAMFDQQFWGPQFEHRMKDLKLPVFIQLGDICEIVLMLTIKILLNNLLLIEARTLVINV